MKRKYLKCALGLCLCLLVFSPIGIRGSTEGTSISISASANGIPDNTPVYDNNTDGDTSVSRVDARDVFGDVELGPDTTGISGSVKNGLQTFFSLVINIANPVFVFGMLIHFVVDALMMAFPVVASFMSTKCPIRLFSRECAKVCGVTYSYSSGGDSGSSGGIGGGGDSGGEGDGKGFMTKVVPYLKERGITLIICGALIVMCSTQMMPKLIYAGIDLLLGFFFH